MKRFLSVLAASALLVSLAAVSAAQDAKDKDKSDKAAPAKEKDKDKSDKAAPAKDKEKEKSDKDTPKTPAASGANETPYYPLKVGNAWYYRLGENRYVLKVAKFEKVGDVNCARVEMLIDDKVTSVEHIAVTPEGVARVAFDDKKSEPPLVFLKLPVKKGEEWKINSVVGKTAQAPGEKVTGTFKESEGRVKITGAEYDAVSVSTSDLDANGMKLKFTYYFAKDIGMVKQEIEMGAEKVIIELERFEPAK